MIYQPFLVWHLIVSPLLSSPYLSIAWNNQTETPWNSPGCFSQRTPVLLLSDLKALRYTPEMHHSQLTKRSRVAWVESKGIDFTSQRGQRIDLTFGPTNKPIAIIVALSRVGPYLWEVVGIESYLKGRSSVWDAFNWSEGSLLFKREVEPDS